MKYTFASVLTKEMSQYLSLMESTGRYIAKTHSTLKNLDKYLVLCNHKNKELTMQTIVDWLTTREVSHSTKIQDITHIKGFCKYLSSLGIKAVCPEKQRLKTGYLPYIFSDEEFQRIAIAADNFNIDRMKSRASTIFPALLRLLYGCGLRLSEGRNLRWNDVDLDNGVLTIRCAKNQRQRLVPMDSSMTEILISYQNMVNREKICSEYLFESKRKLGEPLKNNTFYMWFSAILRSAGIIYSKQKRTDRGPCPHCLRHLFTKKSFLKSEAEGRRFEDTSPFLSAYLGHDGIKETERYLRSDYSVYEQSHARMNASIGALFPEVNFDEE